MVVNACPCMSLQRGSMTLAIADAVISMLSLGLMIVLLIGYLKHDHTELSLTESERRTGTIIVIVLIVIYILQVLLAFRLYYGARNKDYRNCRIWLLATIVATTINTINIVLNFTGTSFNGTTFGGTLFVIIYKLFEMTVVYNFLQELKLEMALQASGYGITAHQQTQQPYMVSVLSNSAPSVYATPQSRAYPYPHQEAYAMQQYSAYPATATTVVNPSYPAPVHRVTTS